MSRTVEEHTVPQGLSPKERSQFLKTGMEETANKSEKYKQIAGYMFWAATALIALTVGGPFMAAAELGSAAAAIGISQIGLTIASGVASLAAFAGSLHFGKLASDYSEKNDRLYSKKQAMDIASSIVAAQQQSQIPVIASAPEPMRRDGKTWVQASGADRQPRSAEKPVWTEHLAARSATAENAAGTHIA